MQTIKHRHAARIGRTLTACSLAASAALAAAQAQPTAPVQARFVGGFELGQNRLHDRTRWFPVPGVTLPADGPDASWSGILTDEGAAPVVAGGRQTTLGALNYLPQVSDLRSINGETNNLLVLANDWGAPVLVTRADLGMPAGGQPFTEGGLTLAGLNLLSTGTATVHGRTWLDVSEGSQWAHAGMLVVGASDLVQPDHPAWAIQSSRDTRLMVSGLDTRLSGGFGQLDIVVGSAIEASAEITGGAQVLASSITLGAVGGRSASTLRVDAASRTEVAGMLRIGRESAGNVAANGTLLADRIQVGTWAGGAGASGLDVHGSTSARMLEVGTDEGAHGTLRVLAGRMQTSGATFLGGSGLGEATVDSAATLDTETLRIDGHGPAGRGSLVSDGTVIVRREARLSGQASWISRGSTRIDRTLSIGSDFGGGSVVVEGGLMQVGQGVGVGYIFGSPSELVVQAGATLRLGEAGDGQVSVYDSGRLGGSGRIEGNVSVTGGTVAPGQSPGWLTITGDLRFSGWAGGTLVIEIGGPRPGIDHDVLDVQGTLDLGENVTLELREVNGYHLQWTDSLNFLRAASYQGAFAGFVNHTSLPGLGLDNFETDGGVFGFNPDAAGLPAVPEPGTQGLLLAGLAALLVQAGRRATRRS